MSTILTFEQMETARSPDPNEVERQIEFALGDSPSGMSVGVDSMTFMWDHDLTHAQQDTVRNILEGYRFEER